MTKLYAVILEPFNSVEPISDNMSSSKENKINKICAIISESDILLAEKSALALGYKYYEKHKKEKDPLSAKLDILSYTPPGEILCTKNRIFRIKGLGQLFIQDFEKGLLAEAYRQD